VSNEDPQADVARREQGAKARVGRTRQTRAQLEQQLKVCRQEIDHAHQRLVEAKTQQIATSKMLRLISNSPIQSVLDAVAEHAARLCDASNARIWRLEDNLLRLVASYGESSATMDFREGLPVDRATVTGRAAYDGRTIHVHDIAAEDSEYPVGSRAVKGQGWHTTLATPLLREGTPIGVILVRRLEVRPFYDKEIALLEAFADQAVVAIENVRLFEAEKQRTLALAHANRDLAEREAKIRRLVDANIIGIFFWDSDGAILEANEAFLHMVGYDHDDLVAGRIRWTDLTPPDWRERDVQLIQENRLAGSLQPFEKEYFRKDGSRVPVLIGVATFEEGKNQGVAFVLDQTKRKCAEEALRRSEAHLTEAQRLSHSGVTAYNETTILYGSEETYRIWGFDPGQGVPSFEAVIQRVHPDDRNRHRAAVQRALDEKRGYSIAYRIVMPDGTVKHLESIAQPVFSAGGEFVEVVATQIDVTERKRKEERLRVQHTVAQILAEAATIEEASPRILLAMGECLGWDVGVLWRVDWDAEALRCLELWHNASIEVPEFERVSRESSFGPGLGLPGRVWSSLEPEYIADVVADENFPRAPAAEREGLRSAFGFPILLGGEVLGVIELFSREISQPDRELLNVLASIGSQIGQFIERKDGEEALRDSEGKFRDYAETASDWFWEIGPDYKFTLLTENAFGSDAAARIGTWCWEHALDFEAEPEKWRVLGETLDARRPFRDFVYRTARGDGAAMYVKASGKAVFDADGEFRGYRGTGSDLTAIMRAQEALRESEQRSRSALDGIAGLVAVLTPNGELETVNRQLSEYFGRSLEWLKNWGTNDAVHPEDLPRVLEHVERGIASGIAFDFELRVRRFDGEYHWFENRHVPIHDDCGRIARWYVLLTDIEDRTRALARLEQMQSDFAHMNRVSMMGELTASLSHEVTQPIAAARNYARAALNFLDRRPPDLDEARKQLGGVMSAADRSREIIERIRDHIKKAPPRKACFDLNRAIDEVIALGRSAISRNGVSVRTLFAEGLAPVQGDRVQLQQVVLNLVLNAVEAMGEGGAGPRELMISTEQHQANGVVVSVRDSGPGINPENLERVFEAFYTTKSTGIGMGLSICRSIIDAHGGRLWASVTEPHGAAFQFTLPHAEKEIMDPRPAALHTRERCEDSASAALHPPAYRDNQRPHRSGRVRDQRRSDRQ
jgi:PAS domain S-box-containing protein